MDLTEGFWDNRYKTLDIGWDLGKISPPLKNYFDQLTNKNLRILIPGGGNSYEAEYLHHKGFNNVYVVDLSKTALKNIKTRVPSFPSSHLIQNNFFDVDMRFDVIIEQTFFCAIHPSLRLSYAAKLFEILHAKGKVVGLLFNVPLKDTKPPFGGCKKEYLQHFNPYFDIKIMEEAKNSVVARQGKELFFIMQKKKLNH
ncbi:SAM-dependent methyltransferase [Lacinutrix sp. C3R15]|nr:MULTISPECIES: methyltransferase domain-containing protein [Flavobacteriaceae]MBU2940457.1 SAM-dependent methyltransferase [Lacinutrix sp. C3R15]MDO6623777.1 SAM-dependent methyltransferase [Oceanihabitans sp. 1_MG-2023]